MVNLVFGFDVSTITIGYTVLDANTGNIQFMGAIDVSDVNKQTEVEILDCLVDRIDQEFESKVPFYDSIVCAVEDYPNFFSNGKSRADIILSMMRMNILLRLAMNIVGEHVVSPINVATARKSVVGTIPQKTKKKEHVFQWFLRTQKKAASDFLPIKPTRPKKEIVGNKITLSSDPKQYQPCAYDMVDAYIIAYAQYLKLKIPNGLET